MEKLRQYAYFIYLSSMQPNNCLNCGSSLETAHRFCAQCGQQAGIHRLHFHDLWHDTVHYFTHADKGIFHLIKELAKKPGIVAREYIEGRRKAYFRPLNFFLIVAGILVFMTSFFHVVDERRLKGLQAAAARTENPVKQAHLYKMAHRMENMNRFVSKYSNVINMLATPLMALVFWLVYKKGKYNFVEHLVANLYFVPFVMIFYALLIVPLQKLLFDYSSGYLVLVAFFLFEIVYRGMAYYQFMGRPGAGPLVKALAVSFLTVALWFAGVTWFMMTYVQTGFGLD